MKRTPFKQKEPLTEAQQQLREAHRQFKQSLRSPGRARIKSRKPIYKGIRFDSEWELECFKVLEARQKDGEISNLDTHVTIVFEIKNEEGVPLKQQISVDFTFYDNRLKRHVRADAKPPKKLDRQKADWFLRWELLKHVEPDYQYEIFRMHSTWRDLDI
jgi:hypothetical protein